MRRGPRPNLNRKEEPRQLSHEERQELERKAREFRHAVFCDFTIAEKMFKEDRQVVHLRDGVGETAFHYVVIERHLDLAAKLLVWEANINTQDSFGTTPLIHAVSIHKLETVRWLVERGASIDLKTVNDETALAIAADRRKIEVLRYLLSLPRRHPIDFYFDDLIAEEIFRDTTFPVRDELMAMGLTRRFEESDSRTCERKA